MKLAKELLKEMSIYFKKNRLKEKLKSPINEQYIDALRIKPLINFGLIDPNNLDDTNVYNFQKSTENEIERLKTERKEDMIRFDLVIKGSMFLYLNEIISWKELRFFLNLDFYKEGDSFIHLIDSYNIIISLLSVLFGKITYEQSSVKEYKFERLTGDRFYWNQPTYYFGYKASLSYNSLEELEENINWFLKENPHIELGPNPINSKYILGMIRMNNSFSSNILDDSNIETELDNLPLYNISLNVVKFNKSDKWGMRNIVFDFYKSMVETTKYTEDDEHYVEINWSAIREYSKYVDTIMNLAESNNPFDTQTFNKLEKMNFIFRELPNFLLH